jgi:hypothetical protein
MKPLPIFFVGMKPLLCLGMRIWAPFWSQKILRMLSLEAIWDFGKATGLP